MSKKTKQATFERRSAVIARHETIAGAAGELGLSRAALGRWMRVRGFKRRVTWERAD